MKTDIEIFVDNSILVGDITADGRNNAIAHLSKKKNHKQWIPIFKSMKEYADQEMIAFAEWIDYNEFKRGFFTKKWHKEGAGKFMTTSQLLTKYKEEREK